MYRENIECHVQKEKFINIKHCVLYRHDVIVTGNVVYKQKVNYCTIVKWWYKQNGGHGDLNTCGSCARTAGSFLNSSLDKKPEDPTKGNP